MGVAGSSSTPHKGTLFLDEVSDLSPAAQAKLLRAIQDLTTTRWWPRRASGRHPDHRGHQQAAAGISLTKAGSGWTSTIDCMASRSRSRRCARGARTSPNWPDIFSLDTRWSGCFSCRSAASDALGGVRPARQRPGTGTRDRARGRPAGSDYLELDDCRRHCSVDTRTCWCRRCAGERACARGEAVTQAGTGAMRQQQASGVSRAWHSDHMLRSVTAIQT